MYTATLNNWPESTGNQRAIKNCFSIVHWGNWYEILKCFLTKISWLDIPCHFPPETGKRQITWGACCFRCGKKYCSECTYFFIFLLCFSTFRINLDLRWSKFMFITEKISDVQNLSSKYGTRKWKMKRNRLWWKSKPNTYSINLDWCPFKSLFIIYLPPQVLIFEKLTPSLWWKSFGTFERRVF